MNPGSAALPLATAKELVTYLDSIAGGPSVLAFDGDGTLWSGDVSDDVYFAAADAEWLLEAARPALTRALRTCGLDTTGSLGTLARRLHDAQAQDRVPERLLFEVMAYCYAGHSAENLTEFATNVLTQASIERRIRYSISPVLDWARDHGHECFLVSASPAPIVKVPATALGFDEAHVIASTATDETGQIRDEVTRPIPYLEQKVTQLCERMDHRPLLAAFGDSPFDISLLSAAKVAVAVEPKPRLTEALRLRPRESVRRWLVNQHTLSEEDLSQRP